MDATEHDKVSLNEFFQSMSEVGEEERDWKRRTQFLISLIQHLSELTKQQTQNHIEIGVFGSSAEDLKCCLPYDIGDIDVMVYPTAEEAVIDDSIIEYEDDINPIYVRLRGKNHPLLQHCLAENSDFVAAPSLKEFHPKLFDGCGPLVNLIPKVSSGFQHLDPGNMAAGVVNPPDGPSFQIDMSQAFGSITEQVKQNLDCDGFAGSDDFRKLLEMIHVSLNPSREFTEEHSACLDEYWNLAQRKTQALKDNPSVETFYDTLNQLMSGEEVLGLKQKVPVIDQRRAKEKAESDNKRSNASASASTLSSSEEATEQDLPEKSTAHDKTNLQEEITHRLVDGMFGNTPSTKVMEPISEGIQSGVDLVPALKARGWPRIASAWSTRLGRAAWPSQEVISKILDNGFHVVVKTPHNTDQKDQFFRLSFSRAELILSGELNSVQRESYRCLKKFYRSVTHGREPKVVTSYFLKTLLFWTVEETGVEFWNENNRAACVLMLLERLYKSLESKFIPHYFAPTCNLLEGAVAEHAEEVDYLANEFRKIHENPTNYPIMEPNVKVTEEKPAEFEEPSSAPQGEEENEMDAVHSLDGEASTSNTASSEVASREEIGGNSGNPLLLNYADFRNIYKEICEELISLVVQGNSSAEVDPMRTILDNFRAVASKMQNPEAELRKVLNCVSQLIYTSYMTHPGNTAREKILSALKEQSRMFVFIVAQDDLLTEQGNEQLILDRMMNSESFDLVSSLFPNVSDFFGQFMRAVDPPRAPASTNAFEDDDIPLD